MSTPLQLSAIPSATSFIPPVPLNPAADATSSPASVPPAAAVTPASSVPGPAATALPSATEPPLLAGPSQDTFIKAEEPSPAPSSGALAAPTTGTPGSVSPTATAAAPNFAGKPDTFSAIPYEEAAPGRSAPSLMRRAMRAIKRMAVPGSAFVLTLPFKAIPIINFVAIPVGLLFGALALKAGVGGLLDKRPRVGRESAEPSNHANTPAGTQPE